MTLAKLDPNSALLLDNSAPAQSIANPGARITQLEAAGIPFVRTVQLTSAAAATPVSIVADSEIPAGYKVYVDHVSVKVNGATNWATTANVKIQDTNGTPVDFMTYLVAALTGNAFVGLTSANVTVENALALQTGGTAGKGLQIKGDANGTGSTLYVTVYGRIAP
ncbi:hypothetical protein EHQ53_14040 [Leptospira langatensis]|uniref:Uncharacterized protein n=1 Tax=Leptospira langatensis TaxID=2484983 RepID=A0ABY2MD02_9LEPT|nr:hypothetical protein [Leptospira langatensis]TGL39638.1 hypothetical protein EHQ53_14040 [Leptospira langatensis]